MQSLWNEAEAAQFTTDLEQRVYTSRLLGRDPSLVMHGGGNTSIKLRQKNLWGDEEDLLYVKGSGWNLETIEARGFAPVRMSTLLMLAKLETLSDTQMANELRCAMTDASAPSPSVEAILHAIIPAKVVDHTHADAIIAVTNTADGRARIEEIYGDGVAIIPYIMPGFKLARLCAELLPPQMHSGTEGIVLLNHGIFSFGETARESYERMIALVGKAEAYLDAHNALHISYPPQPMPSAVDHRVVAAFRREASAFVGVPLIVSVHDDDQALGFARRVDMESISQQGPLTPDHVIRTKRLPLVGRDLNAYAEAYRTYFAAQRDHASNALTMLDPAPRVVLDAEWGMLTMGRTAGDAAIVEDIYRHTINVISRAALLGGYRALPAADIFDVEYWDLEQAKLRSGSSRPIFSGEVALVTGAASGIGKACADAMLARGAAVVALDINPAVESLYKRPDFLGVECDVADDQALVNALKAAVHRFGGLDMLVLNAGIFPASAKISDLSSEVWDRVMRINLDANLTLMREAHPLLALAPKGGRVAVIGSKNVPAPGPGAAAYSASKAALTQLMRVAALEWGSDNIRVNMVHPNAVFDTGLWTDDILAARAKNYGLSVEAYKTNNVLKVEVTSRDVGELVATLCSPVFSRTTGAQVPIDGGNDRVI